MKKLLAILLMCALFAPTAVRLLTYVQCTLKAPDAQVCDCNLSGMPDQNNSLPEKQKEILEQANLKFVVSETGYTFSSLIVKNNYTNYHPSFYTFTAADNIFHPPLTA